MRVRYFGTRETRKLDQEKVNWMAVFVGIDPGLSGAVAVITNSGRILFADTPVIKMKVGKSTKSQINIPAAVAILQKIKTHADQEQVPINVVIEKVNAMPPIGGRRTMGTTSAFNFGMGFGIWLGILAALQIPYTLVAPVTWKKKMMEGMTKEKGASIQRATQLFPQAAGQLTRVKDHGRSDALLLAAFGMPQEAAQDRAAITAVLNLMAKQERPTPKRRTARSAST